MKAFALGSVRITPDDYVEAFNGFEDKVVPLHKSVVDLDIKAGKWTYRKERWANVSGVARSFVERLLVVDPETRMTAQQALEHPWILTRAQGKATQDMSRQSPFRTKL